MSSTAVRCLYLHGIPIQVAVSGEYHVIFDFAHFTTCNGAVLSDINNVPPPHSSGNAVAATYYD